MEEAEAMEEAGAMEAGAMQEDLAEASAEATPDFQAAMSGACTPLKPVPSASGQCLVPGTVPASIGMS